jgi:hypothetical protein
MGGAYQFERAELDWVGLQNSLAGSFVAVVAGYYGFRRLSRYPGVRSSYNILPSFAASFGIVLAIFFFARLDYSRVQFLASFAISVIWYYVVYFKLQRQQRLTIGVVPYGDVEGLMEIGDIDWVRLETDDPNPDRFAVIVADLRADIPDHWERFLADRALNGTLCDALQADAGIADRPGCDRASVGKHPRLTHSRHCLCQVQASRRLRHCVDSATVAPAVPGRGCPADPPRFSRADPLPAATNGLSRCAFHHVEVPQHAACTPGRGRRTHCGYDPQW